MTLNVLYSAPPSQWDVYHAALVSAFDDAGLDVDFRRSFTPDVVDYIVYAPDRGPQLDFAPFTRLKAVMGLWAGVERIVKNQSLKVPLTRMVDSGLQEGMIEWVTAHALRHHLGMDTHLFGEIGAWDQTAPPLARNRSVGILGMGELGGSCAQALARLNFRVSGWSRSEKWIDGVTCFSGDDGLESVLRNAQILVLLLPLTKQTENLLNGARLAMMPKSGFVINPGRGRLIDDDALLLALDSGHIAAATLDVFRTEPLPKDHPYWAHPNVVVTPHIASESRPNSCAAVIADNIRRSEAGEQLNFVVDRAAGY